VSADDSVKPLDFRGRLRRAEHEIPVSFKVHTDDTGELVFAFEEVPLTSESAFILDAWRWSKDDFPYFGLTGEAVGQISFATEHLYFKSVGPHTEAKRGSYFVFDAACKKAAIRRPAAQPFREPVLIINLRGFQSYPSVSATCQLGELIAGGSKASGDAEKLSGRIQICARKRPLDIARWRAEAERLLDHIRRVMSFACGSILADPSLIFFGDKYIEICIQSRDSRWASAEARRITAPLFETKA
jgi:hypothetical protein